MKTANELTYAKDGIVCAFDPYTGRLASIRHAEMTFETSGLLVDLGADGRFSLGVLEFRALEGLHTWELPPIVPSAEARSEPRFLGRSVDGDGRLAMEYGYDGWLVTVTYFIREGTVEIEASARNLSREARIVEGVLFLLPHVRPSGPVTFEFPGNVPHGTYGMDSLTPHAPVTAGLVNPVVHSTVGDLHYNILFVDEEEKWSTGVYKTSDDTLAYANLAAVECRAEPGETLRCGTLYVQLVGRGSASEAVRRLYAAKGWTPPADGIREGVLYACHPHGTMDSGFLDRRTMAEFANELPGLRAMGIDHVWVLPIFEHLNRGVYHPTDQAVVDPRYGTDADVAAFVRAAHRLGMTVLFDYVPHGPEPDDPLGIELRRWASVDRTGTPAIEWNCLSFDMANPEYLAYIRALVHDHADRFDIDGSRIDCAMGGLSNWIPYPGNRPSSSNLKGGAAISKTIREAFLEKGKTPLVTPENFNPVPVYAPYTDVFYDMALYRVLYELEAANWTESEYAARLVRWLDAEMKFTPAGYVKLRFLGNHDTVSWVWHKRRATATYGEGKAKALWALLAWIDGMPMIYQGDEDAAIYRRPGPELREFFASLFASRRAFLGNDYDIEYYETGSPIILFGRSNGHRQRLAAVNVSAAAAACALPAPISRVLHGAYADGTNDGTLALDGYGYVLAEV